MPNHWAAIANQRQSCSPHHRGGRRFSFDPEPPAYRRMAARHHQPPRTTAAAARVTLLRPCSSTPNFQNCGNDRQCGYTDRTRVRTPHEPNERVAVPTVGVGQASGMRFPAISTVLRPPPAGAPGRSPVGVWRIRVNAVRRARPSGIGAPFPVLSPPSDLFISVVTCDSTQVIQNATSSNRHGWEPPGDSPPLCHPTKPQSGCQFSEERKRR